MTSEFLSDASPLKPLILGLLTGASELPAPLKAEVDSLVDIPICGSLAEDPHAKAQRVSQATRAAGWLWAWPRIQLKRMRCHRNNRHSVTRTLGTRKFQASHARKDDAFKKVYLAFVAVLCKWTSNLMPNSCMPPCMRTLRRPRAAISAGWTQN